MYSVPNIITQNTGKKYKICRRSTNYVTAGKYKENTNYKFLLTECIVTIKKSLFNYNIVDLFLNRMPYEFI